MPESYDEEAFLRELEPKVGELLERHIVDSKLWFPHELVPWGRGRDYKKDEEWDPTEFPLPEPVRAALFVNLLTEDNLPYYFHTTDRMFGGNSSWGEWTKRWTAEEMRHAEVIRGYITVTNALDLTKLEIARMKQVSNGEVPEPETSADGVVYVTLQELATKIAHTNTGKRIGDQDKVGGVLMNRVAIDEGMHHRFYRDLGVAAIELDASSMVIATERQVRGFAMPGTGIENFSELTKLIAEADIYNLGHFKNKVVDEVLKKWKFWELKDLSDEAETSRERLKLYLARLTRVINGQEERKAKVALASGRLTTA